MTYPLDKYRFVQTGNKIIALSTYAGKTVRGVAICSSEDSFSIDKGKELAAARCALKIANKRFRRATDKLDEAYSLYAEANAYRESMLNYYDDAAEAKWNAEDALTELLASL